MVNRTVRALIVAASCLMLVAWVRMANVRAQAPQPEAPSGTVATGRTAFASVGCEACHGQEGRGTAAAPRIAGAALQLPAFTAYVRKPTGTMPPHSTQLVSDQNLADIYAFLRTVPPAGRPAPAGAAPAGRVEAGAVLYKEVGCFSCHVNEAQGGANGPRIGPDPIPFARFSSYVRNPSGNMPPYTAKVLSDVDLADIYAFLEARPRPPAVGSIPSLAP